MNMPLRLLKQDLMEIVTDSGPTIKSILGSMEGVDGNQTWWTFFMENTSREDFSTLKFS